MRTLLSSALALVAALPLIERAQAERYTLDPVHSRVLIRVSHAGFAQAMATLSAPRGHIDYDPDFPEQARVEVELPLDRLDFGDADWNRRMARRDYFDSEQHPIARFVSTSVQPGADGELRIQGELELRGMRAPVELRARINRLGRNLPYIPRHSLGASATALLDRRDFGMDRHASVVGDAVEVWIEVEARRQRRGGTQDARTRELAPADDTEETRESRQPREHDRSSTPSDDKDTRDATAQH
jgi:polyisoprenoid-binding protein YceI